MTNKEFFHQLGLLYRKRRIALKIKLLTLATRCAISVDTMRAIERGSESVKIGSWLAVADVLGLGEAWKSLLVEPVDPFAEYDRKQGLEEKILKRRVRS
ncbi:MAG: helix-turn-helix transcriptional regulator [Deltaproteobacteria bacterium]|nr:helix-turn-helix transcriptional regulator [Deltaproteobacteria bacterium]